MKNFKGLLAMVCAAIMVFSLGACGSSDTPTSTSGAETAQGSQPSAESGDNGIEPMTLVLANCEAAGATRDLAMHFFAERVAEYTDGKVIVDIYSGGQLGDMAESLQGLPMGTCHIYVDSVGALASWTELANIDAIPYMYKDAEHFYKVTHSEIADEILEAIGQDAGYKLLGAQYRGVRITTSNKKFLVPEEVKGLKIRTPSLQVYIDTWAKLGAVTTPLSLSEVYTAIEQGTVDAQENPVDASFGYGLADACDYLILTNHVYSFDTLFFDQKFWDSLSPELQDILTKASEEAMEYRWELVRDLEEDYIQRFEDAGCEIVTPDIDAFIDFYADFAEEYYPDLLDWVDGIKALG